jgi:hypothetical protein
MVHPHVGPVQGLHHHAINARRLNAPVAPDALASDRCQLQGGKWVLLPIELRDKEIRQVERHGFLRSLALCDAVEPRGITERLLVGNAVGTALAFRHFLEQQHQMAAMIRVRRGPARDLAHVVARHDRVRVRTAHAARRLRCDAAWPHVAQAAAHAVLAEGALVALSIQPPEAGFHAVQYCLVQHLDGRCVTHPVFRLPGADGVFGWSGGLAHKGFTELLVIPQIPATIPPPLSLTPNFSWVKGAGSGWLTVSTVCPIGRVAGTGNSLRLAAVDGVAATAWKPLKRFPLPAGRPAPN